MNLYDAYDHFQDTDASVIFTKSGKFPKNTLVELQLISSDSAWGIQVYVDNIYIQAPMRADSIQGYSVIPYENKFKALAKGKEPQKFLTIYVRAFFEDGAKDRILTFTARSTINRFFDLIKEAKASGIPVNQLMLTLKNKEDPKEPCDLNWKTSKGKLETFEPITDARYFNFDKMYTNGIEGFQCGEDYRFSQEDLKQIDNLIAEKEQKLIA